MLVPYKCCVKQYEDYYVNQAGNGLSYYQGQSFQKGYGIGGWFKRLFRTALPFLTRGAKSVGKEVLKTGTQIANDLLEGQNLEDAAKHRVKETGRKLAREAIKRADDMLGQDSPECAKSELNLFTLPPTQTVIEKGQWIQFHPIANVTDGGPVEFLISGSGEDYLDLSQTQLYVKAKILKNDGKVLTDDAILETILNHGYDSKTSQLTSEIYYKDTAGRMNIYDDDKEPNEGFSKQASLFKKSVTVDMIGRLHEDLFNPDRLLLNLVDLKIKLIRSKPEFCLMGNESYKIVFDHVSIFVRKVHINPGVPIAHAKALEKATAKYPIDRVNCKVFSIPQSSYSFIQDNVFSGQMPKRIVLACVDNDAFNGNYKKSPFEFNHYNMSFVGVYIDGQPMPHQPLELDFEKENYIGAYQNLLLNSEGLYLSRNEFAKGYSLFLFDLTPDLCDGEHFNLIRHSNLRIELKFSKALEQTVSLIVFAEFESLIEINKARNVLFDFEN
ncbi:uncharacterized protein F54H12.2 [Trichonephila inaurata madagascariensis]|uniref:Uncharacterized protein F54H12.2 n=1 Tax=Trichonephila inaurata madagascariensis TaxID=2747483 RepID=A0A8X6YUX8_9ARAC|nr:uncharacterized protein F54H12.2 [Trichonephila inaurata madagascariensis]